MNRLPAVAIAASISLALLSPVLASQAKAAPTDETEKAELQTAEPTPFDDQPFADLIAREAKAAGVPIALAHAVVFIESSYRPNVTGRAGEVGLMQIKPATARDMGFRGSTRDLYDPATNLRYGMKYLAGAKARGGGTTCGTILKYNAGHYATRSNPVSRRYCERVKVHMASF